MFGREFPTDIGLKPNEDDYVDVTDYKNIKIKDVLLKPKNKILYEYDFGDGWEHQILLEKIIENEFPFNVACIDGWKACPRKIAAN